LSFVFLEAKVGVQIAKVRQYDFFFVFSQCIIENSHCTLSIVNCQLKNLFTLLVFGNAVFYLCAEFKEETIWQETFSIDMCG
jgi:hypothetical protein